MNQFIKIILIFKRSKKSRNEVLNKSDKYILSDYPISIDQQMTRKTYRILKTNQQQWNH